MRFHVLISAGVLLVVLVLVPYFESFIEYDADALDAPFDDDEDRGIVQQPKNPDVKLPPSGYPPYQAPYKDEKTGEWVYPADNASRSGLQMENYNPPMLDGHHWTEAVKLYRDKHDSNLPVVVLKQGKTQTVNFDSNYLYLFVDSRGVVRDGFEYAQINFVIRHGGLVKIVPKGQYAKK